MPTLEQRLGRAGRDPDKEALFLFYVERKYFLRNQKTASEKVIGKKRTSQDDLSDVARKRSRLAGSEQIYPRVPGPSNEASIPLQTEQSVSVSEAQSKTFEELLLERKRAYHVFHASQNKVFTRRAAQLASAELEPAISDMVNADEIGLNCRRIPKNIEAKNDGLCESFSLFLCISHTYLIVTTTITSQTQTTNSAGLVAAKGASRVFLGFVVTSITRLLSKSSFSVQRQQRLRWSSFHRPRLICRDLRARTLPRTL